ncbi:MAG: HAMP domain-containing protein [Candidatus Aminicenantes bacterium]|nr:HAMP domain-containing protein [Candidatus Aminicenantes bacterium]
MKIRFTLQQRLLLWIVVLLVILVGAIVFVIQRKEASIIFEETKSKGVLIARNTADRNLQSILAFDVDQIQRQSEAQTDESLLYIVFYDRYATPLVHTSLIADQPALYQNSLLQGLIDPNEIAAETRDILIEGGAQEVLEVEVPLFAEGSADKWGSVRVGLSLAEMRETVRKTRRALLWIGFGGLLFGLAGSTLLARQIVRPLRKLVEGTVRISRGEFTLRIEPQSRDEVGELAASFNDMTEKLQAARREAEEAQRRLVQSEKLAQIGRLAASIAHEIRNPLTSVKLNIQKVLEDSSLPELEQEHLFLSQEGIAQIEKFIKEMLNFTRATELQPAPFAVEQIVEESLKMMRDIFREKEIQVEKRLDKSLPEVVVDGDRLRQVLLNLFRNAVEAVETGGRIVVSADLAEDRAGRRLRLHVSDNGPGIPEKDWENVFEPFFTTKSWGIGLGLANARKLIELHRGTIRVVHKRSPGTAFEIQIPIASET